MRKANGEGSVYRRKDGRYEAALWMETASGIRKRVRAYGRTRSEAHAQLVRLTSQSASGVPVPDRSWRLADYLDYWLSTVAEPNIRPRTLELYELIIRRHIKPTLGRETLHRLGVPRLQVFFNERRSAGASARLLGAIKTTLGAALSQAVREELIVRNPARLVRLPAWRPKEIQPWKPEESGRFLTAAADDPLYTAFVLLVLYGLRRGEVLGLRWSDVDFAGNVLHVRQQIQRLQGRLVATDVKTDAGRRDLPLVPLAAQVLFQHRRTTSAAAAGDLVFTTRTGQPIEPGNLARSFQRISKVAGLPRVTLHNLRHANATLLKSLGVPVRDAQAILGHASPLTTQQIYQHADLDDQRRALDGVDRTLTAALDGWRSRQMQPSRPLFVVSNTSFVSGGPGGTRTHDILLKSPLQYTVGNSLTEALQAVRDSARQLLVGHVAVGAAVSVTPRTSKPARDARYWLGILNSPNDDR